MMNSRELLYVKTVADEQNISKAAKLLFVAQPSLSQSIQRIEETLGTKLFIRGTNGLKLTYAGEQYYQMACQVLKIYDDFEDGISDINDLKAGHIRFGIPTHLGGIMLPVILKEFTQTYPNIHLNIYESSTSSMEARLLSGDLDFTIMHAPVAESKNPSFDYEILSRQPFVIVLANDNPLIEKAVRKDGYDLPVLDAKLLEDQQIITLHKEQRIRQVTDAIFKKAHIAPNIRVTTRNYMTAERLAASGVGVTLLPSDYLHYNKHSSSVTLLAIEDKYNPYWCLCIETLKDGYLSHADQRFLDIARDKFIEEDFTKKASKKAAK